MAMEQLIRLLFLMMGSFFMVYGSSHGDDKEFYCSPCLRMVREDIKKRGIDFQRLLDAMLKVKRHLFVPEEYRHMAMKIALYLSLTLITKNGGESSRKKYRCCICPDEGEIDCISDYIPQ
jgi:hypothetical protein